MSTIFKFNLFKHLNILLFTAVCCLVVSACGKIAQGENVHPAPEEVLTIGTQGNQLLFDTASLRAQSGNQIKLTLKNNSTNFEHNWVLVDGGTNVAEQVYKRALATGEQAGFLPDDMDAVVTYTEMVAAGQQETILFTAPTIPGSYTFLCTFPGHYLAGMTGTLLITTP